MDRVEEVMLLSLCERIGPATITAMLRAFPEAGSILHASRADAEHAGLHPAVADELVSQRERGIHLREIESAASRGLTLLTPDDPRFPAPLQQIALPPPLLYVRGSVASLDRFGVAIVGARRCTPYGRAAAARLASGLALRGVAVASGLARGIDAAAHRGALEAEGITIAVLGCGLARMYPSEHATLADCIVQRGALVSEFPLEAPPLRHHFPRRNRLISGLSAAVVVVEATHKSGSLVTAGWALDQGREVFAVPGRIDSDTSRGAHQLLRDGAGLVENVEDILREVGGFVGSPQEKEEEKDMQTPERESTPHAGPTVETLGPREKGILSQLSSDAIRFDEIVERTGFAASVVSALLTLLELKGFVRQLPGKWFAASEPYGSRQRRDPTGPGDGQWKASKRA